MELRSETSTPPQPGLSGMSRPPDMHDAFSDDDNSTAEKSGSFEPKNKPRGLAIGIQMGSAAGLQSLECSMLQQSLMASTTAGMDSLGTSGTALQNPHLHSVTEPSVPHHYQQGHPLGEHERVGSSSVEVDPFLQDHQPQPLQSFARMPQPPAAAIPGSSHEGSLSGAQPISELPSMSGPSPTQTGHLLPQFRNLKENISSSSSGLGLGKGEQQGALLSSTEQSKQRQRRDGINILLQDMLYISGIRGVQNDSEIRKHAITAYLNVAVDVPMPDHITSCCSNPSTVLGPEMMSNIAALGGKFGSCEDLEYLHLPLRDGGDTQLADYFLYAFHFIRGCVARGMRVLLFCREGKSRSGSIAIAFLMEEKGMSYEDALEYCRSCREAVDPNLSFCSQLSESHYTGSQSPGAGGGGGVGSSLSLEGAPLLQMLPGHLPPPPPHNVATASCAPPSVETSGAAEVESQLPPALAGYSSSSSGNMVGGGGLDLLHSPAFLPSARSIASAVGLSRAASSQHLSSTRGIQHNNSSNSNSSEVAGGGNNPDYVPQKLVLEED